MNRVLGRSDVFWAYASQALNMGAGLLLLPFVLRYLPSADVGLWFVFLTLAGIAQLLETGFQPTLVRNAAYVVGGARVLHRQGVPDGVQSEPIAASEIDRDLMLALVAASRSIYRCIAAVATVVLLVAGSIYVASVLDSTQLSDHALWAWAIFAFGQLLNFYFGYYNGILLGRGDLVASYQVVASTRGLMVVLGAALLWFGTGLLGLALASLISGVVSRYLSARAFWRWAPLQDCTIEVSARSRELVRILWHNAGKLGMVNVGAFLIQRANVLLASTFLGLEAAAAFAMTNTLIVAIVNVSIVGCYMRMPRLNALQAIGDRERIRSLYATILSSSFSLFVVAAALLLIVGGPALRLIGSHTPLLETSQVALLCAMALLELNHTIAANYLTSTNQVPFVAAALLSGAAILLLSWWATPMYGVWALIVVQGSVQLLYNNWRWPWVVSCHLGGGLTELTLRSFAEPFFRSIPGVRR